jgi:hypothetical protein
LTEGLSIVQERGQTGDDENMCLRGILTNGLSEVSDDRCIGVEDMAPCHACLPWDASRNDNDLDSLECITKLLRCIPIDFSSSLNMAHIGSDARSPMNIIQAKGVSGTHSLFGIFSFCGLLFAVFICWFWFR